MTITQAVEQLRQATVESQKQYADWQTRDIHKRILLLLNKIEACAKQIETPQLKGIPDPRGRSVYIFEMEDGGIRIGSSGNIRDYKMSTENYSGLKVTRCCTTVRLKNAMRIETEIQNHFAKNQCPFGKFFKGITYDEARDFLAALAELEATHETD